MSWPSQLVIVRHAESTGNVLTVDDRAAAQCATYAYPLTERGIEQAKETGIYVRDTFGDFDAYFTSYYERAKETMRIIYPEAKVYEDARLAEANRGIYHFMTRSEVTAKFPEELARKDREGLYHYRPFGGENWPDVELRIHSFVDMLRRDYVGKKVFVVGHGHWLILFNKVVKRMSVEWSLNEYKTNVPENASAHIYLNGNFDHSTHIVPWTIRTDLWKSKSPEPTLA